MTAKAERITYCIAQLALLRGVEREVQSWVNIRVFVALRMIRCRRHNLMVQRQRCHQCLHRTRRTQQMTGHRFGGRQIHLVRMFAKRLDDRLGFCQIA